MEKELFFWLIFKLNCLKMPLGLHHVIVYLVIRWARARKDFTVYTYNINVELQLDGMELLRVSDSVSPPPF